MKDPYKILGVSPNSSDDEIKAKYRDLAKKYHPDNYANNPLSDLAVQKMQEINDAYDYIIKNRKSTPSSSYSQNNSYNKGSYNNSSQFSDIRKYIDSGRYIDAEQLLDGIPSFRRDAEWYYLKGCVMHRKGWLEEAYKYYKKAVEMDPGNFEYTSAFNSINKNNHNRQYYDRPDNNSCNNCSTCDICAGLICLDCCCDCC